MPGGKVEMGDGYPFETYHECAARELKEETGLIVASGQQEYLFGCMAGDGSYCITFATSIEPFDMGLVDKPCSLQGDILRLATWKDLFKSKYCAYYECLRDVYKRSF